MNVDEDDKGFSAPIIPVNRDCTDVLPDNKVSELAKEVEKMGKMLKSIVDEKSKSSCRQHCCSSKNIKFMVQLPTENRILECKKREKHKLKKLKRLNVSNFKIKNVKKRKTLSNDNWQVETCTENFNLQEIPSRKKKVQDSRRIKSLDSFNVTPAPGAYVRNPVFKDTNIATSESQALVRIFMK